MLRCYKRFFVDGFKVNRLGRRNKTCLECTARSKADRERRTKQPKIVPEPEDHLARQERVKNDVKRFEAEQLQRVLDMYRSEFPHEVDQPTTEKEVRNRRTQHRFQAAVAKYAKEFPEDTNAALITTRVALDNRKRYYQLRRDFANYARDHPNDPNPPS